MPASTKKALTKAVVFDAYGTLFDVYSISALAENLYPGQGNNIAALWRDKQIDYSRLITMSDPHSKEGSQYYLSFWEITKRSLDYTLQRLKLEQSEANTTALLGQYSKLSAYQENLEVLKRLKTAGLVTAILSNGSPDMLQSAVSSAGMTQYIDHIISVDRIKAFKTSPASYALVRQTIQVELSEILFVSSNGWDALGASWFGFETLWVNRAALPYETIGPRPKYTGSDLNSVLDIVE